MIYACGDTHGSIHINKLSEEKFPQQKNLTKDDYVIVCGDFGLVWYDNGEDYWWRDWLSKKNFTTLFVDGNHENFELLYNFPKEKKFGGTVHKITDSIYHLCRGQVFEIEGKKIFTMGGAKSQDKMFRRENVSWWRDEMPNYMDYEEALYNLEQNNWTVDYIFTHCAPTSIQQVINPSYEPDVLTIFLDQVAATARFKRWYFGHYHIDFHVRNYYCLFNVIEQVTEATNAISSGK